MIFSTTHLRDIFEKPCRDYFFVALVIIALLFDFFIFHYTAVLFAATFITALPTFWGMLCSFRERRITIDTFNSFALVASFATGEMRAAAFIVLMLAAASILDWYTESRARDAVEELLKLKPPLALRETSGVIEEISAETVQEGDSIVIQAGSRVPVDGTIIFGSAYMNESSVTGESAPVERFVGDTVLSPTINESGAIKIRATRVGKNTTIERMASLVAEASRHKSSSEKLADRFAALFLPFVALLGAGTYLLTRNVSMMVAIFLVACADDMAVAIPLAITAALGKAAKRGVIIKGGERLDIIGRFKTLVLDKTGTLTYGVATVERALIEPGILETDFWKYIAVAEKFSEHHIGKAILREAARHISQIPDPDEFRVHKGSGVWARLGSREIIIGNQDMLSRYAVSLPDSGKAVFEDFQERYGRTVILVFFDKTFAGMLVIADKVRDGAVESIRELKQLGIERILMFTGDNEYVAGEVAKWLGIDAFHASMTPEEKLRELEVLIAQGITGMVGDGINDAPALARSDVGIAMGGTGTAAAVAAADVVILTDDLSRLPEMVRLARKTRSVIHGDIWIWALSNIFGFALVLTGVAGPALAAFYNFIADFFPLINSARLFRGGRTR